MRLVKVLSGIFIISFLIMAITACSSNGMNSPVAPGSSLLPSGEISTQTTDNRSVVAVYDAVIDPATKTFSITFNNRSGAFHFPLSNLYPDTLSVTAYGFSPNFWANIKLTHPYPGSGIKAYDPRVIAILPANPGVSFHYPVLNLKANNKVVLEPDGYTRLFDELGGSIPGNANPFIAYFKEKDYRVWSGYGVTEETKLWNMDLTGFGGGLVFKLVVDVSTNYPQPPQPVVDNAPEPVEITANIGTGLNPLGGNATIDVTLLDWHDQSTIGGVKVESPALFNGTVDLQYAGPGPNPDEYVYSGSITNEMSVPYGEYNLLIVSWDEETGFELYQEFKASVVAFNPTIVNTVKTLGNAHSVKVADGYAYVGDFQVNTKGGLHVIDIDPPESASIKKTLGEIYHSEDVFVNGQYAYVADGDSEYYGVNIFNIDPPESTNRIGYLYNPTQRYKFESVYVSDKFAFTACDESGLLIVDIYYPASPTILKTVDTPGQALGVHAAGGYAYVADGGSGLQIIDAAPRESAHIIKTVDTPGWAEDVWVSGGYAYVADNDSGLQIIDIDPIDSAHIVGSVDTSSAIDVKVVGGYAFVADYWEGLKIIDINPPESPFIVQSIDTTGEAYSVDVVDGYAYVADFEPGLVIIKSW